ncbi:guanylate kinase [Proteiniborus ethanoligenes]|uniref:Guanylate kinase n=1 Tax=Proteiniborus ethanoligenes TaxID=415015 RepID=A0A1H3PKL3_9FIRM|nr:guanylate kinase [Proteiniborus ethanoligenes]TAH61341.1 MAG: guanylate kinase [Gottschalkiaceae bacterium]SDZ01513.1 guanylate kinase [Proteiniborus ethanoligenes]
MGNGLLIVISGPSGVGKGTVCRYLLDKNKEISLSVSSTTRAPRIGEIDKVSYFFTDKEQFEKMINNEEFLEYAYVHGNYYGTPKKNVLEKVEKGQDVLLEIDIQGALQVKEFYPDGVFIFILPPTMEELKKRIVNRGTETEAAIEERFKTAYKEIEYVFKYDYAILNDEIELAVKRIESIIEAEKCKVKRQIEIIKDI